MKNMCDELEQVVSAIKEAPEDCKIGNWCKACNLHREVVVKDTGYSFMARTYSVCGKGLCKNFKGDEKC